MVAIDSYEFGRIVIDGKTYTSDIIVSSKGVNPSWWRKRGHQLQIDDLEEILRYKPTILIVGTGYSGVMKVKSDVVERLRASGIRLIVLKTTEACREFNSRGGAEGVVAALHLTC